MPMVTCSRFKFLDQVPRSTVEISCKIRWQIGVGDYVEIAFWTFVGTVVYVYLGYPLLLWLLKTLSGGLSIATGGSKPSVSLVISAFNEEEVIEAKLKNSLALDYQQDLLQIIVVSDASDDGTDDIVRRFKRSDVQLLRMEDRGGKTLGLNEAVATANGEIIIFSDANAMYEANSVSALVRNFDDPTVGAVVGESTYADSASDSDRSESVYWRYELAIKRLESALGSVVGGDGAIYAIRRSLYRPMASDALSDFVNPLQVVEQGWRCVYEPDAVSVEDSSGSFDKEFRRKVRIVNRAWRAAMSMKRMMNPLRHGLFAFKIVSHKLLRWLVPIFLVLIFALNILLLDKGAIYVSAFITQAMVYMLAMVGWIIRRRANLPLVLYVPFFFCLVNIASLRGIYEAYRGQSYVTWSTVRVDN